MEHFLERKDPTIDQIVKATFPEYKGRTIKISTKIPEDLDSYWFGGSRDYFAFYQLSTGKVLDVETNHPFFDKGKPRELGGKLPEGIVLVEHSIFCGKDMGITSLASRLLLYAPTTEGRRVQRGQAEGEGVFENAVFKGEAQSN